MLRRSTHVLTSLPHKTGQRARIQECNWGGQHLAHKQLPQSPAPLYNFTKRRLNRNGKKKKIPSFQVAFSGCINCTLSWRCRLRFHLWPESPRPGGLLGGLIHGSSYTTFWSSPGATWRRDHLNGGCSLVQKAGNRKCVPFITETRMQAQCQTKGRVCRVA